LRLLLAVAGVALVGGIVAIVVGQSTERKASARTGELTVAINAYNEAFEPSKVFTSTVPAKLVREAEALMPKFSSLTSASDGVGELSRLYLADLARRAGDHAKAESLYRDYLKDAPASDPLRFTALEGLGYALEAQGKLDDALTEFAKLGEIQDKAFADLSLKHQGRVKETKGDKPGAAELYKSLLDKHAESKLRDFAEQRLSVLE
jgi:predicted negative regulator of RcsB-dependent stress response